MSYLEKRNKYVYFVKQISFLGKIKTIKKYVGKESLVISKNEFLWNNLYEITKEELDFRLSFFPKDISYDKNIGEKIEFMCVKIMNVIESRKLDDLVNTFFYKRICLQFK